MSNKKRSSKRLTRVPLKFGDSIHSIVNKNNRKANVDGSIEDIENDNGHGGSGAENGKGNGVNQEFIRDLMGDASLDNVGVDLEKGTVDTSAKYNSVNDKENVNAEFNEKNVESDQCNNTKCDGKSDNTNRNEKLNGAWDKSSKFADILAASKLDNRLLMIPTEISESGEEVVVFNDEIIENGREGRVGFARVLVEINAEKEIKDKIEIVYKGKNITDGLRKVMEVEYAWKPFVCKHFKVFGHDVHRCIVKPMIMTETRIEKENENVFTEVNNKRSRGETNANSKNGFGKFRQYKANTFQHRGDNVIKENTKKQNIGRFEYRKINVNEKADEVLLNRGKEKVTKDSTSSKEMQEKSRMYKEYSGKGSGNGKTQEHAQESNRFSLSGSLVNEEDLVLNVKEREEVDVFLKKKLEPTVTDKERLSTNMKRYYRDKKELMDAVEELELEKDVVLVKNMKENVVIRNVVEGVGGNERKELWRFMKMQKHIVKDNPWIIVGDFNVTLDVCDHSNGSSTSSNDIMLQEGDKNTAYFHKILKGRKHKGIIVEVSDEIDQRFENEEIRKLERPYLILTMKKLLGQMVSHHFKEAWKIMGEDVCRAIKEFFDSGKMLGELNATVISLMPKVKTPCKVTDYRPIACCNVIYKGISKILTNRLKAVLGKLVSESQSAFIAVFALPRIVIKDINKLLKGFMWRKGELVKGRARVAWDSISKPKDRGGIQVPVFNEIEEDTLKWVDNEGNKTVFSTKQAWKDLNVEGHKDRNARVFGKDKSNIDVLFKEILEFIKMKLMNLMVKDSKEVKRVELIWDVKLHRVNCANSFEFRNVPDLNVDEVTASLHLRLSALTKEMTSSIMCLIICFQVFSNWMAFGGNTRDLGSFGEETNKIMDLHQIHEEVLFTKRGDGVTGIMRRRRDLSSDGVRDLVTTSGHGRLKEDLESST
ncbi:RNA-directed DNA polymerase, eukaryota, reverse transcriptase zinc-binding domain protein [Tanacetum coccineum]